MMLRQHCLGTHIELMPWAMMRPSPSRSVSLHAASSLKVQQSAPMDVLVGTVFATFRMCAAPKHISPLGSWRASLRSCLRYWIASFLLLVLLQSQISSHSCVLCSSTPSMVASVTSLPLVINGLIVHLLFYSICRMCRLNW